MTSNYRPSRRTTATLRRLTARLEGVLERHKFLGDLVPGAPSSWVQWDALPSTCTATYKDAVAALYRTRSMETLPLPLSPVALSPPSTMIPLGHEERAHAAARLARGLVGLGCPQHNSVGVVAAVSRRYLASDVVDVLQSGGYEARLILVRDDCESSGAMYHLFDSRYLVWLHTVPPDVNTLPSSLRGLITLDCPFLTMERVPHCDFAHNSAVPFFAVRLGGRNYAPPDDVFVEVTDDGAVMATPLYEAAVPLVRFVVGWADGVRRLGLFDRSSLTE